MLRVLRGFEKARVYEIEIPRVRQNNTEEQLLMNRAQDNKLPTEVDFSFNLTTILPGGIFKFSKEILTSYDKLGEEILLVASC